MRGGYGFAEVSLLHPRQSEIYKRETARAIFWGGLLPSAMLIGAATLHPGIAMGLLIYVIQICQLQSFEVEPPSARGSTHRS